MYSVMKTNYEADLNKNIIKHMAPVAQTYRNLPQRQVSTANLNKIYGSAH